MPTITQTLVLGSGREGGGVGKGREEGELALASQIFISASNNWDAKC